MSGWVQPSRPEIRRPTANSSAGSVMPALARSIICPQRSITYSAAVWNSCSLLSPRQAAHSGKEMAPALLTLAITLGYLAIALAS